MNTKQLVLVLLSTIVLASISLSPIARSETEERQTSYSLTQGGLRLEIEAPIQAWPGDKLNITIRVKALTEIYVDFIHANISCLMDNMTETLIKSIKFLENLDFNPKDTQEKHYEMVIPENTLPGLIYGTLRYRWYIKGDIRTYVDDAQAFQVTFVQNKAYEELRQDYEALNSLFNDLQANYTDLDEKYQQSAGSQIAQNNATGLMYLFLITTGIFVVTTILLLIRRPKTTTW